MTSDVQLPAAAPRPWYEQHRVSYLESGGSRGHELDFSPMGERRLATNLLLKATGRRSGEARVLPLIYGIVDGEAGIVASKGGTDTHPAGYLDRKAGPEVEFRIATQAFRATWREPEGASHQAVWDHRVGLYPPYRGYKARTQRAIPQVMPKPIADVATFTP